MTQTIEGGGLTVEVRRLTRGDKVLLRFPLMRKFLPDKPEGDDDSPESFLYTEKWNFICISSQAKVISGALQGALPTDSEADFEAKFDVYLALDDALVERIIEAMNSFEEPVGEAHTEPVLAKDADPN